MTTPTTFITAPVRIIQGRPYPIHVGTNVLYDGQAHTVTAVENNARTLRIARVGQPSLTAWITV